MGNDRGGGGHVTVEDRRRATSLWIERAALERLAERCAKRRLVTARSVYLALVELATEGVADATRATIASYAGVTRKTLDDYVPDLEAAMVLRREHRGDGAGSSLTNLWVLVDPEGGGHAGHPGHRNDPVLLPTTQKGTQGEVEEGGGSPACPPPSNAGETEVEGVEVPAEMFGDAMSLLRSRRRVDGRQVTDVEMLRAAAAIATFNRASGSDYGLGAHLTPVVGRLRERPSWDAPKLVRLVESAWRVKWWERSSGRKGRPTPAVIFGNARVFEAVAQDARDEAEGRKPEPPEAGGGRYTRED